MPIASRVAPASTGAMIRPIDTPLALSAVISLSDASRLKAYNTATSTAMGSVMATVNGMASRKNSAITDEGRPLPTRSPKRLAMKFSSSSDVSAVSAKASGPRCSRRT